MCNPFSLEISHNLNKCTRLVPHFLFCEMCKTTDLALRLCKCPLIRESLVKIVRESFEDEVELPLFLVVLVWLW